MKTISRVLITDGVDTKCGDFLKQNGIDVTYDKPSKEKLLTIIDQYDGLIVRSATKVTSDLLAKGTNLQVVGRAGTGVDNIDTQAATKYGVIVMNTPGGNTISAAEHTCGMICALSRMVPQACAALKQGKWDRKSYMGNELYGKTLAIIGLGRIGREVSQRMKAFGMTIIGYDPIIPASVVAEWGVESLSLEEIWPRAHYITVHTPLIPATRGLIGADVFKKCQRGVRVVNVARGGIIDESDLLKALESGECGGAGLDVFTEEPPTDTKLCQHPKVICTPHLGANTSEAQSRVALEIAEQIVDLSTGRPLTGVVNAPSLTHALSEQAAPWVHLSETLGYLANRLTKVVSTPSVTIDLSLHGPTVCGMSNFLGSAALVGMLRGIMTQNVVNLVNAPVIAQEAGISIQVATHETEHAKTKLTEAVRLVLHRGDEQHELVGSVVGGRPTLYSVDGAIWEAGLTLGHNMLFFTGSANKPSPLTDIASNFETSSSPLTSLLSSAPAREGTVWYVARSKAPVDWTAQLPHANLVASVAF